MFAVFAVGAILATAAVVTPAPPTAPSQGAEKHVQLTLVSDGETWVSITNVRAPAKLKSVNVALAPGEYEVMGRRRGYRDVQKSVRLQSDGAPITLTIICTVHMSSRD